MKINCLMKCSRENFFLKLSSDIRKFNSTCIFPICLKQKENLFIITTGSILTREIYIYFKAKVEEYNSQSIIIKGKVSIAMIGKIFLVSLMIGLVISFLKLDWKNFMIFLCVNIILYVKYFFQKVMFNRFLKSVFKTG